MTHFQLINIQKLNQQQQSLSSKELMEKWDTTVVPKLTWDKFCPIFRKSMSQRLKIQVVCIWFSRIVCSYKALSRKALNGKMGLKRCTKTHLGQVMSHFKEVDVPKTRNTGCLYMVFPHSVQLQSFESEGSKRKNGTQ